MELGYDRPTRRIEAKFTATERPDSVQLHTQLTLPPAALTHTDSAHPILLLTPGSKSTWQSTGLSEETLTGDVPSQRMHDL